MHAPCFVKAKLFNIKLLTFNEENLIAVTSLACPLTFKFDGKCKDGGRMGSNHGGMKLLDVGVHIGLL